MSPTDNERALPSSDGAKQASGPFEVLRVAIKAVPAVKYALGVAGVMAALAIGRAFFSSTHVALIGALSMLGLMVLLLVFSAASKLGPRFLQLPALVLTWAILIIFVLCASLTVTSAFFEWPKPLPDLIGANFRFQQQNTNQKSILSSSVSGIVFGPSGDPLGDVTVTGASEKGKQVITKTDSGGAFQVSLPGSHSISLEFKKPGYTSKFFRNLEAGSNSRVSLDKETR